MTPQSHLTHSVTTCWCYFIPYQQSVWQNDPRKAELLSDSDSLFCYNYRSLCYSGAVVLSCSEILCSKWQTNKTFYLECNLIILVTHSFLHWETIQQWLWWSSVWRSGLVCVCVCNWFKSNSTHLPWWWDQETVSKHWLTTKKQHCGKNPEQPTLQNTSLFSLHSLRDLRFSPL